ncbi:hypothetical protein KC867_03315 [Candidatus Saccharibacteria bacterium]|nr:hypothetical protein [Candidatus Saccharibacteria bacterium]
MSVVYDEIIIDRAQFRCECSYELIKDLGQKIDYNIKQAEDNHKDREKQ